MIPAQFDYLAPTTLEEALAALSAHGDDAKVLAGGQSLLPVLRMRLNAPEVLIDLGGIDSLKQITDDGDTITIGAMAPYYEILAHGGVRSSLGLLHKAIGEVADPQIRHRGTLGGALVHADPAGDCGAPTLALDAELLIQGPNGNRTVAAADFFEDLFTTAVGEDELLTGIRFPKYDGWGSHYEKFVRVAHQWPIVAIAATVQGRGRHHQRGADRPDQHGLHTPAGERDRAGTRRAAGDRGRRPCRVRPGGRGQQPALGPQRRRRLPQAPRHRADPAGRARRRGGLTGWS